MHKIEIRRKANVPENKLTSGMNTELLIDGVQIKTAQSVTLEWNAAGICTATIKMVGNIQAEFYGEEKPKLEDQQFLLIPTGENAARLSTVALERVRRGSEEEADLRAKQDEALTGKEQKTWENATPEDVNDFGELVQDPPESVEETQNR